MYCAILEKLFGVSTGNWNSFEDSTGSVSDTALHLSKQKLVITQQWLFIKCVIIIGRISRKI